MARYGKGAQPRGAPAVILEEHVAADLTLAARNTRIVATLLRKAGGPLSKSIRPDENGQPVSYGDACKMTNGEAVRTTTSSAADLAGIINGLQTYEALALGDHGAEADTIDLVLAKRADPAKGRYGRTKETFSFRAGKPAWLLLDFDLKGASAETIARIEAAGGVAALYEKLIPGLTKTARVIRPSTSSGLRNSATGETFPGSGGFHTYLAVKDGSDIGPALKRVEVRAWLMGFGWIMIGARGIQLVRSLVDTSVGSPERLIFEGAPTVEAPLAQDPEARKAVAYEGELLDTRAAVAAITSKEKADFEQAVKEAKGKSEPEAKVKREKAIEDIAAERNISVERARAIVESSMRGVLLDSDSLEFDDPEIGRVTVADVIANPKRFHEATLADPLEGIGYGTGKAKVYVNTDGRIFINSMAHGKGLYQLKLTAEEIEACVLTAGQKDAPYLLADLLPFCHELDQVIESRLIEAAAKIGKVGKKAVTALIRRKRGEQAQAKRRAAPGGDRIKMTFTNGKRPEHLMQVQQILANPEAVGPGTILDRGQTTVILRRATEETTIKAGNEQVKVPASSLYLALAKPEHVQAVIDRSFALYKWKTDQNGGLVEAATDCPPDFGRYVHANAHFLPIKAIARAPMIRKDGTIMDKPGYDAAMGIFYAPEIEFPPIPDRPTQADAAKALERLRKPFRGFPFATDADRDAAPAFVLTCVDRPNVPRAPGFLARAPEAGTGKTKLFETGSIIAYGTNALIASAEVLNDETELRKAFTTFTLAATQLTVFDNVERGGAIKSPGLAGYLTTTVYTDRRLGVNEAIEGTTSTVIAITGNGVAIEGDSCRRIIPIDIDAGTDRPTDREFDFDCEAEAREERAELVVAALTIMRAHALAGWPFVPPAKGQTKARQPLGSFEDWDKRVAAAIVYAGGADIVPLIEKSREMDPERFGLGEVFDMLKGIGATDPVKGMKAGEIIKQVDALKGMGVGAERFDLLVRLGKDDKPNARRLGTYLTKNRNRVVGDDRLIVTFDGHDKVSRFAVLPANPDAPKPAPDAEPEASDAGADAGLRGYAGTGPYARTENEVSFDASETNLKSQEGARGTPRETPQPRSNPANGSAGWEGEI